MPTGFRKCKVCGKEYEYCKTNRPNGLFRWNDVACCESHASIYFAKIAASREINAIKGSDATFKSDKSILNFSDLLEDEEDELFEEDFEDEDDEVE